MGYQKSDLIHIVFSTSIRLEDCQKITLFASTTTTNGVNLDKEVITLLPLPGTEGTTHIFKHRCYKYFENNILNRKEYERFCITGNPGTGKTFFSRYVMSILLKESFELLEMITIPDYFVIR